MQCIIDMTFLPVGLLLRSTCSDTHLYRVLCEWVEVVQCDISLHIRNVKRINSSHMHTIYGVYLSHHF